MSMETSDAAERVLTLERKLYRLRKNLDDMVSWRMPAAEQQLAMAWAYGRRQQSYDCNFSLTVQGCNNLGVPGATVTITETSSGNLLATGTTNGSGVFAVNPLVIPANPTAATIAITSPATDRLASQSFSTSLTPTMVSLTRTLSLVSSSWHCVNGLWYPLPDVLHVTDSVLGNSTMTWSVPNVRWLGGFNGLSFPGCGPCPPNSGVPGFGLSVTYTLLPSTLLFSVAHPAGTGSDCPGSGSTHTVADMNFSAWSITGPPFSATGTGTTLALFWYCSGTADFTITE